MTEHEFLSKTKAADIREEAKAAGLNDCTIEFGLNNELILIWEKGVKKAIVVIQGYIYASVTFENDEVSETHEFEGEDNSELIKELVGFLK